jgi:hypothetical protein
MHRPEMRKAMALEAESRLIEDEVSWPKIEIRRDTQLDV